MPSLSARACAVQLISDILERNKTPEEAISRHKTALRLPDRDQAFLRHLLLTCLRHLGTIDALLQQHLTKIPVGKARIAYQALRLGAAQILYLNTPAHAAVHAMVETMQELGATPLKGLVNSVLKQVIKAKDSWLAKATNQCYAPSWLLTSLNDHYGEALARAILQPGNPPPLDLTARENALAWAEKLGGELLPNGSIRLKDYARVESLPGYQEGAWWVQDAAAALPVALLGDLRGKQVLELCAAPGGKTAQLLAAGANVTALDRSPSRLRLLHENLERLKMKVACIQADILTWHPDTAPEIIVLDAPCSATGTLRRHPELLWQRQPEEVQELAALQRRLLQRVAAWVPPGGRLLYCVCSLQPEEGEQQIAAFLKEHSSFRLVRPDRFPEFLTQKGTLRTHPALWQEKGGMDGFFAALLTRD